MNSAENKLFISELKRIGPTKRLKQIRSCRERLKRAETTESITQAIASLDKQEEKIMELAGPYFEHMSRVANNKNMSEEEHKSSIDTVKGIRYECRMGRVL